MEKRALRFIDWSQGHRTGELICNEPGRGSKDRAMPEKMESKDGAAPEFGDDEFNEASSVFRSCFDSRKKTTV